MDKFTERVTDSLRELGLLGAIFFAVSLAFIALGVWRFSLNPELYGLKNYLAWGGWLLVCLPILFVATYVFHHAPVVFVLFIIFWFGLSFVEPHVAIETGMLLLCVLGAPVVSTYESFIDNDLIRAVDKGQVEKALRLIRAGVDVNTREGGRTALHDAVRKGLVEIVRALLQARADVNAADSHGVTPLMAAVSAKHREIVGMLIEARADINARDSGSDTPLIKAAFSGDVEILRMLIQAGADVNARGSEGYSALKWATVLKNDQMASTLRNAGACEEPKKT